MHGLTPRPEHSAVCFNLIPGVGEYFVFPALTTTGPCEIMVFEGVPGGPMDCWGDVRTPAEHLARSRSILETFLPWEAERCAGIELTDEQRHSRRPVRADGPQARRRPAVGRARCSGVADVVVLNDPITGQGSNNAAKCAASYLAEHRRARRRGRSTQAWMESTFERYWDNARYATEWTNALLSPPPPHVLEHPRRRGLTCPRWPPASSTASTTRRDFVEWFMDPAKAAAYLAQAGSRS